LSSEEYVALLARVGRYPDMPHATQEQMRKFLELKDLIIAKVMRPKH